MRHLRQEGTRASPFLASPLGYFSSRGTRRHTAPSAASRAKAAMNNHRYSGNSTMPPVAGRVPVATPEALPYISPTPFGSCKDLPIRLEMHRLQEHVEGHLENEQGGQQGHLPAPLVDRYGPLRDEDRRHADPQRVEVYPVSHA